MLVQRPVDEAEFWRAYSKEGGGDTRIVLLSRELSGYNTSGVIKTFTPGVEYRINAGFGANETSVALFGTLGDMPDGSVLYTDGIVSKQDFEAQLQSAISSNC